MIKLGINALNHDASVTVFDDSTDQILFAGHAERYSRIKNDFNLNRELILDALNYCGNHIDQIIWHENPWMKHRRYLKAGQWVRMFTDENPKKYLKKFNLPTKNVVYGNHHLSHAAGGFYTSPFNEAAVVVVDAIGELATRSVYHGIGDRLNLLSQDNYPHSLGLFYSAFTALIGLKPNEEEYILMGMAAYGDPDRFYETIREQYIDPSSNEIRFRLKQNLHKGISSWELDLNERDCFDIAAAVQKITEEEQVKHLRYVQRSTRQRNLVLSGGVALNCVANSKIAEECGFKDIWIMPNPGDAGNSLGAILNMTRRHIKFPGPFLGYDIQREFNMTECLMDLIGGWIVGVANGRAEFGPRALGNRSLLADPRGPYIKDKLNKIKQRQKFRPFAPIILESEAHNYFDMPVQSSPFMQFTAKVKDPQKFPAITHKDGTARVQTLTQETNPRMYKLLKLFYAATGCPMLVNTSLNIKGEPIVNTWEDAVRFKEKYNVKIY